MDMSLNRRYVARVVEFNGWYLLDALDNHAYVVKSFPRDITLPDYMQERIALLRMCEVNKSAKGETIGRKTSDTAMLVYLSYDEYIELINLKSIESAK
jgi:hypothetical protein